jgi:hypothetical protein
VRDTGGRVVLAIYDCLKPVIGAINGAAVGIGATDDAADGHPARRRRREDRLRVRPLGIVPEACSSWFLPRLVGISAGAGMDLRPRPFDAAGRRAARAAESRGRRNSCWMKRASSPIAVSTARSPVASRLHDPARYRNCRNRTRSEAHRVDSLAMSI